MRQPTTPGYKNLLSFLSYRSKPMWAQLPSSSVVLTGKLSSAPLWLSAPSTFVLRVLSAHYQTGNTTLSLSAVNLNSMLLMIQPQLYYSVPPETVFDHEVPNLPLIVLHYHVATSGWCYKSTNEAKPPQE